MELNRRDFLSTSALVGGMAVAGASATVALADEAGEAAAATTTLPVGTIQEDFDNSVVVIEPITEFVDEKTYDVVVIGAGTAGVPAVCAALEEGATVACLQKEVVVMANGNGSSGVILDESNEIGKLQYKQAWRAAGGYRMNPDLLDLFVEHSGETAQWLIKKSNELGLPPTSTSVTKSEFDEGSYVTVALSSFGPKPINHTEIMALLAEDAQANGAEFFYETPAVQLVQEGGAVTGVVAQTADGYVKFNATKAVIVAAGDYQNNESLVERYSPDVVPFQRKQANRTADRHPHEHARRCPHRPGQPRQDHARHGRRPHAHDALPVHGAQRQGRALHERGHPHGVVGSLAAVEQGRGRPRPLLPASSTTTIRQSTAPPPRLRPWRSTSPVSKRTRRASTRA